VGAANTWIEVRLDLPARESRMADPVRIELDSSEALTFFHHWLVRP
jgi:hypothetical protein